MKYYFYHDFVQIPAKVSNLGGFKVIDVSKKSINSYLLSASSKKDRNAFIWALPLCWPYWAAP